MPTQSLTRRQVGHRRSGDGLKEYFDPVGMLALSPSTIPVPLAPTTNHHPPTGNTRNTHELAPMPTLSFFESTALTSQSWPVASDASGLKVVHILRGLPGSGKSELAHTILDQHRMMIRENLSLADQRALTPSQSFGPSATWSMTIDPDSTVSTPIDVCTGVSVSADKFFIDEQGTYRFDGKHIAVAHASCLGFFIDALVEGVPCVVVDNTSSTKWEYANYIKLARAHKYEVHITEIKCDNIETLQVFQARNPHSVPFASCLSMFKRWENDPDARIMKPVILQIPNNMHPLLQNPPHRIETTTTDGVKSTTLLNPTKTRSSDSSPTPQSECDKTHTVPMFDHAPNDPHKSNYVRSPPELTSKHNPAMISMVTTPQPRSPTRTVKTKKPPLHSPEMGKLTIPMVNTFLLPTPLQHRSTTGTISPMRVVDPMRSPPYSTSVTPSNMRPHTNIVPTAMQTWQEHSAAQIHLTHSKHNPTYSKGAHISIPDGGYMSGQHLPSYSTPFGASPSFLRSASPLPSDNVWAPPVTSNVAFSGVSPLSSTVVDKVGLVDGPVDSAFHPFPFASMNDMRDFPPNHDRMRMPRSTSHEEFESTHKWDGMKSSHGISVPSQQQTGGRIEAFQQQQSHQRQLFDNGANTNINYHQHATMQQQQQPQQYQQQHPRSMVGGASVSRPRSHSTDDEMRPIRSSSRVIQPHRSISPPSSCDDDSSSIDFSNQFALKTDVFGPIALALHSPLQSTASTQSSSPSLTSQCDLSINLGSPLSNGGFVCSNLYPSRSRTYSSASSSTDSTPDTPWRQHTTIHEDSDDAREFGQ